MSKVAAEGPRRSSRRLAELTRESTPDVEVKKKKEKKSVKEIKAEEEAAAHKVINRTEIDAGDPNHPVNQFPYLVIDNVPVTREKPDYKELEENNRKLNLLDSGSLFYTLQKSRNSWLSGDMFDKYWIRPPRGKKAAEGVELNAPGNAGGANARDKMARLHECSMIIGPHVFEVRLFTAKDESKDEEDEEKESKEANGSPTSSNSSQEPASNNQNAPTDNAVRQGSEEQLKQGSSATPNTSVNRDTTNVQSLGSPSNPVYILRTIQEVQAKKLQLLNNKEATSLMMKLATQPHLATDSDKTKFAMYLDESSKLPLPSNYIYQPNAGRPPKVSKPPRPVPKKYLQKILTVFEFKENPAGRFVIPRDSILEVLPSGELLISTLIIKRPAISLESISSKARNKTSKRKSALQLQEEEKERERLAELNRPIYLPITIVLTGLPRRVILTIERSVNRYKRAVENIEKIIEKGVRAEDYSVWFHIDDNDEELQERLERPPTPPPNLVFPSKRQYKSRRKREDGEEEEESAYKKRKRRKMEEEARRKAEEEAKLKEQEGTTDQESENKPDSGNVEKTDEDEKKAEESNSTELKPSEETTQESPQKAT